MSTEDSARGGAQALGDAPPSTLAALDLGSNSFHLLLARPIGTEISVLDRLREPVRLAAGLDADNGLDDETLARALESLERFRQRLGHLPLSSVRAVGTYTLRQARRPRDLVARMSAVLGYPIEVLPGPEEARLIYLGVAHDSPRAGRRLVVDIGGGSTECMLGEGFTPIFTDSLSMGCVSFSRQFFDDGKLTKRAFRAAEIAAGLELETIERRFRTTGWDEAVGASGTITAVAEILQANGWGTGAITSEGLAELRKALLGAGSLDELVLPGLQLERRPVLPGGVAVLCAVFERLSIERMRPSKAALREGLLYDLLGRIRHEDVRDRTIRALSERFHVDAEQAARVEATALALLTAVADAWGLPREDGKRLLSWAARLHELGLAIAYSGYHKHGAYVLANASLPGFSREDQAELAALVRAHRRKLVPELFGETATPRRRTLLLLAVLLRLAVRLHRARGAAPPAEFRTRVGVDELVFSFPGDWLEGHPLTRGDLDEERGLLRTVGVALEFH